MLKKLKRKIPIIFLVPDHSSNLLNKPETPESSKMKLALSSLLALCLLAFADASLPNLATSKPKSILTAQHRQRPTTAAPPNLTLVRPLHKISGGAVKTSNKGVIPSVLCAAFCAATIMYPVDLIRALKMANAGSGLSTFQLLSNFKNTHGIQGFFTQGLAPEVARATWMRFLKFGLFPFIHEGIYSCTPKFGTPKSKAITAIVTSVPEVLTIMPLEIAKVQLQLDSAKVFGNSMLRAMSSVWKNQGASGFLVGWAGIQYRQAAWSAAYFASLSFFEDKVTCGFKKVGLDASKSPGVKMGAQLMSGFCAGVFGACLNTPGDTCRTLVQKRIFNNVEGATTFLGVGSEIISSKGVGALYSGFGFKALHLGGGGALMAFFVPTFKKVFNAAE